MSNDMHTTTNRQILATLVLMAATSATLSATTDRPALNGFWKPATVLTSLRTSGGAAPPLNASAQKLYADRAAAALKGDRSFDNGEKCLPIGITRLLAQSPFELAFTNSDVLFLYEWNRLQRPADLRKTRIEFDRAYPYYLGHPMAWWDGNVLVVDSIYFHDDIVLDANGLPHSDALHLVERYSLQDANTLIADVTVDDAKTFTKSWQTRFAFTRMDANARLTEDVCEDRLGLQNLNTNRNRLPTPPTPGSRQ